MSQFIRSGDPIRDADNYYQEPWDTPVCPCCGYRIASKEAYVFDNEYQYSLTLCPDCVLQQKRLLMQSKMDSYMKEALIDFINSRKQDTPTFQDQWED